MQPIWQYSERPLKQCPDGFRQTWSLSLIDDTNSLQFLLDNLDALSDSTVGNLQTGTTGVLITVGDLSASLAGGNILHGLLDDTVHQLVVFGALSTTHQGSEIVAQIGGPA